MPNQADKKKLEEAQALLESGSSIDDIAYFLLDSILPEQSDMFIDPEKAKITKFIHNATMENITVMVAKINEGLPIAQHKMIQETLKAAGNVLGVEPVKVSEIDININQDDEETKALERGILASIKARHEASS